MSQYFSVKNFEQFQHYKDRSPPWIRLYNTLLDDYEFAQLADASKAHLLAIWLLASRYENKIPYDAEWVSRRINANTRVDLASLAKSGFIVVDQSCSETLADCKQVANPETETETETEKILEPNGSLSETSSDEHDQKPKSKKRKSYPPEFEQAWAAYPTDANMSKVEAYAAWVRLDDSDRTALLASIPSFIAYCKANPDYRPIHFVRYVTKRRFEGHGSSIMPGGDEFCPDDWPNTHFLKIRFRNERGHDPPPAIHGGKAGVLIPTEWVALSRQRQANA